MHWVNNKTFRIKALVGMDTSGNFDVAYALTGKRCEMKSNAGKHLEVELRHCRSESRILSLKHSNKKKCSGTGFDLLNLMCVTSPRRRSLKLPRNRLHTPEFDRAL